jgi:hypothetical protein
MGETHKRPITRRGLLVGRKGGALHGTHGHSKDDGEPVSSVNPNLVVNNDPNSLGTTQFVALSKSQSDAS